MRCSAFLASIAFFCGLFATSAMGQQEGWAATSELGQNGPALLDLSAPYQRMGMGGLDATGYPTGMGFPGGLAQQQMMVPSAGEIDGGFGFNGMSSASRQPSELTMSRLLGGQGLEEMGIGSGGVALNGLPVVSADQAMSEFVRNAEAYKSASAAAALQQRGEYSTQRMVMQGLKGSSQGAQRASDLEEEGEGSGDDQAASRQADLNGAPPQTIIHPSVPHLQRWLSAMDPMEYSAPTFSNPVATQFFSEFSRKDLPRSERERMMRLVSSPYMFNQLGNPAYADPKLWSGLVSGAAVPYPMRTLIMAQRTTLPHNVASTGESITALDKIAMAAFNKSNKEERTTSPFTTNAKTRRNVHKLFKIIQAHKDRALRSIQPTPHNLEEDGDEDAA